MENIKRELGLPADSEDFPVKVALASSDLKTVDEHFGSASKLAIFGLSETDHQLLKVYGLESSTDPDANHRRIHTRLEIISQCQAVGFVACGPAVMRQMVAQRIRPLRLPEGTPIEQAFVEVRRHWRSLVQRQNTYSNLGVETNE